MPDLHKTLIIANATEVSEEDASIKSIPAPNPLPAINLKQIEHKMKKYVVKEHAIAAEHAPFRHRQVRKEVGMQKTDG